MWMSWFIPARRCTNHSFYSSATAWNWMWNYFFACFISLFCNKSNEKWAKNQSGDHFHIILSHVHQKRTLLDIWLIYNGFTQFIAFTQRPQQHIIKYFEFNRNVVENTCGRTSANMLNAQRVQFYLVLLNLRRCCFFFSSFFSHFAVATMIGYLPVLPYSLHRSPLPNTIYAVNHNVCTWFCSCFSLFSSLYLLEELTMLTNCNAVRAAVKWMTMTFSMSLFFLSS